MAVRLRASSYGGEFWYPSEAINDGDIGANEIAV